jgi:hypothetical protein
MSLLPNWNGVRQKLLASTKIANQTIFEGIGDAALEAMYMGFVPWSNHFSIEIPEKLL